MNAIHLPQGITITRMLAAFGLQVLDPPANFRETIGALDIQKVHLAECPELVLLFPGCTVTLKPKGNNLLLQIDVSNQELQLLITAPPTAWPTLCAELTNWLEREQGRILAACEECSRRLTERLTDRSAFAAIHELQSILGYDVLIVDKQYAILSWAGGKYLPPDPVAFAPPKPLSPPPAVSSATTISLFAGSWVDAAYASIPLTWCSLAGQQGILGYLGLAAAPEAIGGVERFFLGKAATLLFLELLRNQCILENERLHHRDFLFDLLYNNFDSQEVICSRGKLWGWDFTKPHLVLVGEIQDFNLLPSERRWLDDLVTSITRTLNSLYPGSISLERNNQIVLLFPLKEMLPQSQWVPVAEQLLKPVWDQAQPVLEKRRLFFGLGNLYPSPREIHRSFQEAKSALELGPLLNPDQALTSFGELGMMRLLHKLDHQELEDFRTETLNQLLNFDRESNLELEKTLLTYFACSGDLNKAAQTLFLHPNTLRYRLKKAAEVLNLDLYRLENQLNLYVALKIGRLKALWTD